MAEIKINDDDKDKGKTNQQQGEKPPAPEARPEQAQTAEPVPVAEVPAVPPAPETLTPEKVAELMEKAAERDEFYDKFLRAKAELINYQKRIQRDKDNIADFTVIEIARGWLPVLDDLDRMLNAARGDKHSRHLAKGIKLIEAQLYKVLEDKGIKAMQTVGQMFDPAMHEAVAVDTESDKPEHTIVEEAQKGYIYKDKVVRPAKVKVAKKA
jgi:molecular chaperone GrpE